MTAAVCGAAEELGYAFFEGAGSAVAGQINSFPALWLASAKIVASEGRKERLDTYRLSVCLMMAAPADTREREEVFRILESDALEIAGRLSDDGSVRKVSNVKCTPDGKPVTRHAEQGVTLEMDVKLFYCL